jgi:hypothetical protein
MRADIDFTVNPQTGEGCQRGDADAPPGYVKLYDVVISKSTLGNAIPVDTYFGTGPGFPPRQGPVNCPLLLLCDAPSYSGVCVTTWPSQFIVNPSSRSCSVAVETKPWGTIKAMFR